MGKSKSRRSQAIKDSRYNPRSNGRAVRKKPQLSGVPNHDLRNTGPNRIPPALLGMSKSLGLWILRDAKDTWTIFCTVAGTSKATYDVRRKLLTLGNRPPVPVRDYRLMLEMVALNTTDSSAARAAELHRVPPERK